MNLDTAINQVVILLGNRQDLKPAIAYALEYAREFIIEKNQSLWPWYLLTTAPQTFATVANQAYVALPSDFLGAYEYGFLSYTDSATGDRTFLTKKYYDELQMQNASTNTGRPTEYTLINNRVYLYPTPDAVYNLGIMYYQSAGSLAATPETNTHLVNAADWLIAAAGARVAAANRNAAALKLFLDDLKTAKNRVTGETELRLHGGA